MRIVTWNMQGGPQAGNINDVIQTTQANVLCLQETGNLTNLLNAPNPVPNFLNSLTGNFIAGNNFFQCIYWHNNNWVQGGLAVMTNVGIVDCGIMQGVNVPNVNPNNPRNLPWMTVRNPYGEENIQIYSIHSPPVWEQVTTADVCLWNNAQVQAVENAAQPGVSWAIVGDFNADPTNDEFIQPPFGNVVRGNELTQQNGDILDYSITNVDNNYVYMDPVQLVGASDHYPQIFNCFGND